MTGTGWRKGAEEKEGATDKAPPSQNRRKVGGEAQRLPHCHRRFARRQHGAWIHAPTADRAACNGAPGHGGLACTLPRRARRLACPRTASGRTLTAPTDPHSPPRARATNRTLVGNAPTRGRETRQERRRRARHTQQHRAAAASATESAGECRVAGGRWQVAVHAGCWRHLGLASLATRPGFSAASVSLSQAKGRHPTGTPSMAHAWAHRKGRHARDHKLACGSAQHPRHHSRTWRGNCRGHRTGLVI